VDLTLHRQADGSVAPAASPVPARLSGGGTGAFASVTTHGSTVGWAWPGPLPAPVLSGDTATYPEVLPGVDLVVTATYEGFSEVLAVKSARAASNPALRTLRLKTITDGATVHQGPAGSATALDASGAAVLDVGSPMIWDSTTATGGGSGDPAESDAHGPGRAARTTPMPMHVDAGDLVLVPDPDALRGPDVHYPVYVDPRTAGPHNASWSMINSTYPTQQYYTYDRSSHAKVGFTNDPTNMVYRSLFQFSTSGWKDAHILDVTFSANLVHSYSCSSSVTELHQSTQSLSTSTTWNTNASTWSASLGTVSNSDCNDATVLSEWGSSALTNAINASANGTFITMGLRASAESSTSGWKKFGETSAVLSVTYNYPPNVPDAITIDGKACATGTARPVVSTAGGHNPLLKAHISDPDSDPLSATFSWTSITGTGTATQPAIPNGGTGQLAAPSTDFADGGVYSFTVKTSDGTDTSATGGPCEFAVDTTAPTPPGVVSADGVYLNDGVAHGAVGQAGTFTFSSNGVNDVVGYLFGLTDPPTTSVAAPAAGGSVTVSVTPTRPGTNTLFVRRYDAAGNYSGSTQYSFLVG
jgi:hypothetical protein